MSSATKVSTTTQEKIILGLQHVLAMFGATVLVPILTGLDPAIAILSAGLGTLVFHLCTKGMVPVFLGSSFAFIPVIALVLQEEGLAAVKGGVIVAGLIYAIMAGVIKLFGVEKVRSFFPPIVAGPIIMVIGLSLSPVAINSSLYNQGSFDVKYLIVSSIVVLTMIIVSIFAKGFFKLVPILIAVVVGYLVSLPLGLVDVETIANANWFGIKNYEQIFTLPEFSLSGILAIAPVALVVFIEHIGDITTNSAVVGKDFFKEPGVHRTMLGDGLATMVAGLLGGPANTTYSENTGVLAVTKVYDPAVLRIAAVFAIIISFIGKIGAIINCIPSPVMGGISIILFGMIASIGVRILVEAHLDFSNSRNLLIAAIILVCGIAIDSIPIYGELTISGLTIAAILGVILNKVLPENI
ncbi:MAG: uracil-xanthine permease [Epulopiscium sp.]|jgi:uracil permease|nr:uracil-xanthine permease [Candidatus Epulonipiscium sp.]